jgi:hypothetical protein
MEAGVSRRISLAAIVAVGALILGTGLVLYADSAASRAPGDALKPDLVVQRPQELYVIKRGQTIRLRVSNTVANKGAGPLEIEGGDSGDGCDFPGKTAGRHTLQNIYKDSGNPDSPGYFKRGQDPALEQIEAGCSRYHPSHDHWHFDNFARYTLLREKSGAVAGGSRKVSFCVIDTGHPYGELPGSPGESYYPQDPENPEFPTCSGTSVDGLSIGWEDTYGASLPGQGIRIGKLRRGRYCLRLEADPSDSGLPDGVLDEANELNNVRTIRLALRPRKEFVERLGSHCKLPS